MQPKVPTHLDSAANIDLIVRNVTELSRYRGLGYLRDLNLPQRKGFWRMIC